MSIRHASLLQKLIVLVLITFTFTQITAIFPVQAATQITFGAAGDYGFSLNAQNVMASMKSNGVNFALGVGDFLYTQPTGSLNEQTWCSKFKSNVPNTELIVGNHETWETNTTDGGGSINKFLQYCPFTLGAKTGTYGYQYYFDYPSAGPLARFILVDPGIWTGKSLSTAVSYASGTANYNWVASAIDNARSSRIPWVIVVMHKVCITTGTEGCEVPMSFLQMLMDKRVDLIIQGHDHTYERSKQLTCATAGTYIGSCVANAGSSLTKGAGSVIVIDGTGGEGGGDILSNGNSSYFVTACCNNGTPLGYSLYTITSTSLQSTFVRVGGQSYSGDSFTITGAGNSPSFTLSASPTTVKVVANHNANSKITVTSQGGFTGTVTFSATVAPSTGLKATVGPTSVNVPAGGSATTTLTVNGATGGNYTVTVDAVSGDLVASVFVGVAVSDFSVSANPATISMPVKGSATTTITIYSINGFGGAVNLNTPSLPKGVTVSWTPKNSVTVPSGGNASTTMKVSSNTAGTYQVTVSAAGSGLTRNVQVTVIVGSAPPPDFYVAVNPSSVTFNSGSTRSTVLTVSGTFGFSGTVAITVSSSPATGLSGSCSPSSVTLSTTVTTGTSTCTFNSSTTGSYTVTISGSNGTDTRTASVTVNVADFTISASPSSVSGQVGPNTSTTITLSSLSQFSGTVTLSAASSSSVTETFSPASVSLTSGSATSTLTLSSSASGTFTVTVTGTSGSLSHSTTITYTVGSAPDFSITVSPASLSANAGSAANSTITATSLNGFNSAVSLTSSASPSTGLSCSLSPSSVTPSNGGSSTSTLSCTGSIAGSYTVTVIGTSGSLQHSTTVTYSVLDFTMSANPSSMSFQSGGSGSSTITVGPLNGFTGTVGLTSTVSPSGLSCSLSPSSISGGSGTSRLSCSGTTTGSYTVTVTGTSASLVHTTSVAVQVGSVTPPATYALVTSFSGQVYKLQDGTLTLIGQPVTTALRLISWKPDGSYALIVGDSAVLIKWDGSTLTQIPTTAVMPSGDDLNTVAFNPDGSYALIGGTDGDLLKYDGTSLTKISDPNTRQIQGINWNPTTSIALLVGNGGAMFTYNNGVITILNSGTTNDLYGVAWNPTGAYALISGSNGSILRYDGKSVAALGTSGLYPSTTIVRYVAWNSAGTLALLTGNAGGLLLSYDGSTLAVVSSSTSNGLFSLSWSGNTATIVGNGGTMLAYNAGTTTRVTTGVSADLRGISWKPA